MNRVIFFSGAGLSAESGLATFRASDGLWANYDINKVCNFYTWKENFELVHEFYNKRRLELAKVEPNRAHKVIAKLQNEYGQDRVVVITQNVDDLLERAGCKNIMHLHGELTKLICTSCGYKWDIGYCAYEFSGCPKCETELVKPFVVFFYESAPMYSPMYREFQTLKDDDIVVVIGTSGNVISLDMLLYGNSGYKILNNLEPSDAINEALFDKIIYKPATNAIDEIESIIKERLK